MAVLEDGEGGKLTVRRAGGDDGDFLLEVHEGFVDAGRAFEIGEDFGGVGLWENFLLALPVVAEAGGFEDGGEAEVTRGGVEVGVGFHFAEGRGGEAIVAEESFLPQPLLSGVENVAGGPDNGVASGDFGGDGRDVLDLEGDDADALGEVGEALLIEVIPDRFDISDLARWRVGVRRVNGDTIAELAGGEGQHPAQLAAAEDADGGAGEDGEVHGRRSGNQAAGFDGNLWFSRTFFVCSARNWS